MKKPSMQVAARGNSLAVRLPAKGVRGLALGEADDIEIVVDVPRRFAVRKPPHDETLLRRLRAQRGKRPADLRFDRDEADAR